MPVQNVSNAANAGKFGMGLQQGAHARLRKIRIRHDGVRQALFRSQPAQPARLVERIMRISSILNMDGLDDAEARNILPIVGGKIVATQGRKIAFERLGSIGIEPWVGTAAEILKMLVSVDHPPTVVFSITDHLGFRVH